MNSRFLLTLAERPGVDGNVCWWEAEVCKKHDNPGVCEALPLGLSGNDGVSSSMLRERAIRGLHGKDFVLGEYGRVCSSLARIEAGMRVGSLVSFLFSISVASSFIHSSNGGMMTKYDPPTLAENTSRLETFNVNE